MTVFCILIDFTLTTQAAIAAAATVAFLVLSWPPRRRRKTSEINHFPSYRTRAASDRPNVVVVVL